MVGHQVQTGPPFGLYSLTCSQIYHGQSQAIAIESEGSLETL